jgi:hypothetical protein
MEEPAGRKRSAVTTAGYVATAAGVAIWLVYLVLKYAFDRPVAVMVWIAFALVLIGFGLRRSQS